jgi:mannose-6-phosphate isomerase
VLVKLLDAAERLGVQVHPTREVAKQLFHSPYGKTECWHVVDCRSINGEDPCIYLGFREGVTVDVWKACFDSQDIPSMLSCLHRIPVKKGDTYIVHGGIPHAIGAGCFLVEIQEPTDYTIRTERVTPGGLAVADVACHQGIGFERMFECFTYGGASLAETLARYKIEPRMREENGFTVTDIIYPDVTDMFALESISVEKTAHLSDGTFYGLYVMSGEGIMNGVAIKACDHFLVPASCQEVTVTSTGEQPLTLLRFYGPRA